MFEVGEDVIALRDHNQGAFKAGDIFTCTGVYDSFCNCLAPDITIGIPNDSGEINCAICAICADNKGEQLFCSLSFAPLIRNSDLQEELDECIEVVESVPDWIKNHLLNPPSDSH